MKTLYKETIGKAVIEIVEYGNSWIVRMDEDGKHYEQTFSPSPYPEKEPYALAIKCYDNTVAALQKKYNTSQTLGQPDFVKAVKGKRS